MVSIIIPSFNSANTIRWCLDAVSNQAYGGPYEVLVVDSSNDETPDIVSSYPSVRVIRNAERLFPAQARNVGIENSQGEILAFTDSDCIPTKDWLRQIVDSHSGEYLVVGGSVINARPKSRISRAEYYIEFREFSVHSPRREIRFVPTCNFSAKREVFDKVGLFPAVRASEDTFFAHRLKRGGIPVLFVPEVCVAHLNRAELVPFLHNQFMLGKHAAIVRRFVPMPGGGFVKLPFLFPVLPFVRTLRTIRFIINSPMKESLAQLKEFLSIYPYFLAGAFAWSAGFYKGTRSDEINDFESRMS